MKIAFVDVLSSSDRFRFERFQEIAKRCGAQLDYVQEEGSGVEAATAAWSKLRSLVEEADAFIIPTDTVLSVPDYVELLHTRIRSGSRAIVQLNENCLDRQNAFLAPFDLTGTSVRIRSDITPIISLSRSAESFRDVRLFAGVETVRVQQPNAVWYGGESLPVLISTDDYLAVDGDTDFPGEWNARELACIGAWHGTDGGGILAMSGGYFHDPYDGATSYDGATGVAWPGVEPNELFAKNIIAYLREGGPTDTPEDRCQRIEINLADFVFGMLRASGADWWTELVPLAVRQKCAQRQEEEKNRLPKEAYFDLIDLKTVMHRNWQMFEAHLRKAGCEGGKEKSLAWMDKLNELRRLVGHPLKRYVSGHSFSKDEVNLLRHCDEVAMRLADELSGSGS